MRIGVPKEIKPQEFRVAATPGVVHHLVEDGHTVFVEGAEQTRGPARVMPWCPDGDVLPRQP